MSERLYRSRHERMLAGVAGGLAEMWNADPALVRIIWAVLVLVTGGLALVVYIVMALVVPEGDPTPWPPAGDPLSADPNAAAPGAPAGSGWVTPPPRAYRQPRAAGGDSSVPLLLGGLLIVLGAFFLLREFLPQIDFDWFWPAMLIVLGVVILATALGRDRDRDRDRGGRSDSRDDAASGGPGTGS